MSKYLKRFLGKTNEEVFVINLCVTNITSTLNDMTVESLKLKWTRGDDISFSEPVELPKYRSPDNPINKQVQFEFNRLGVFYKLKDSNEYQQKKSTLGLISTHKENETMHKGQSEVLLADFTFDLAPHVGKKNVQMRGKAEKHSKMATETLFDFKLSIVSAAEAKEIGVDPSRLIDVSANELELEYAIAASGLQDSQPRQLHASMDKEAQISQQLGQSINK